MLTATFSIFDESLYMLRKKLSSMDEKDLKIIEAMMRDGRISKTDLARLLNITEAAVRKRISKLEENKIILGYKAIINYKAAGLSASLTGVDVEPDKLWHVVEKLRYFDEIKSMWLTAGDHTLMMEIVSRKAEDLSKIHEEIEKIEGVKRVCPAIIVDTIKL